MIKIICVGKIKEKFIRDAIEEYKKRILKFTKLEVIELQDHDFSNEIVTKEKEAESIVKYVNPKDYIVTMEIEGEMLDSIQFSKKIENTLILNSNIVFIIGGSYGLSNEIKNMSNFKLSFSKMTFPHQLFRVILLEQIYRAFKIINNESYHK